MARFTVSVNGILDLEPVSVDKVNKFYTNSHEFIREKAVITSKSRYAENLHLVTFQFDLSNSTSVDEMSRFIAILKSFPYIFLKCEALEDRALSTLNLSIGSGYFMYALHEYEVEVGSSDSLQGVAMISIRIQLVNWRPLARSIQFISIFDSSGDVETKNKGLKRRAVKGLKGSKNKDIKSSDQLGGYTNYSLDPGGSSVLKHMVDHQYSKIKGYSSHIVNEGMNRRFELNLGYPIILTTEEAQKRVTADLCWGKFRSFRILKGVETSGSGYDKDTVKNGRNNISEIKPGEDDRDDEIARIHVGWVREYLAGTAYEKSGQVALQSLTIRKRNRFANQTIAAYVYPYAQYLGHSPSVMMVQTVTNHKKGMDSNSATRVIEKLDEFTSNLRVTYPAFKGLDVIAVENPLVNAMGLNYVVIDSSQSSTSSSLNDVLINNYTFIESDSADLMERSKYVLASKYREWNEEINMVNRLQWLLGNFLSEKKNGSVSTALKSSVDKIIETLNAAVRQQIEADTDDKWLKEQDQQIAAGKIARANKKIYRVVKESVLAPLVNHQNFEKLSEYEKATGFIGIYISTITQSSATESEKRVLREKTRRLDSGIRRAYELAMTDNLNIYNAQGLLEDIKKEEEHFSKYGSDYTFGGEGAPDLHLEETLSTLPQTLEFKSWRDYSTLPFIYDQHIWDGNKLMAIWESTKPYIDEILSSVDKGVTTPVPSVKYTEVMENLQEGSSISSDGVVTPGGKNGDVAASITAEQANSSVKVTNSVNNTLLSMKDVINYRRVSSPFGPRNIKKGSRNHRGIDLAAPKGRDVRASHGGVIGYFFERARGSIVKIPSYAGVKGQGVGFGAFIVLTHPSGFVTRYAHLSAFSNIAPGSTIAAGTIIAKSGAREEDRGAGTGTGDHLHYETKVGGRFQNPEITHRSSVVPGARGPVPKASQNAEVSKQSQVAIANAKQKGEVVKDYKNASGFNYNGSRESLFTGVYTAFRKAGLSHQQARIMAIEVGRENSYNNHVLFGGHPDPQRGTNIGFISWQGSRRTGLINHLRSKGVKVTDAGKNSTIEKSQRALDAMAEFAVWEMRNNRHGGKPIHNTMTQQFLNSPNGSSQELHRLIGKGFIRWRYDDPKFSRGHKNIRDFTVLIDAALKNKGINSSSAIPVNSSGQEITSAEQIQSSGDVKKYLGNLASPGSDDDIEFSFNPIPWDEDAQALTRIANLSKELTTGLQKLIPTYKVYLVHGNNENSLLHIVNTRTHAQYYEIASARNIRVEMANQDNPVAVAYFEVLNSMNTSSDPKYPNHLRSNVKTDITSLDSDFANIVVLDQIRLKAGNKIQIRMGYGNDPNSLDIVFNGIITESDGGEVVRIVAEGYGRETQNELIFAGDIMPFAHVLSSAGRNRFISASVAKIIKSAALNHFGRNAKVFDGGENSKATTLANANNAEDATDNSSQTGFSATNELWNTHTGEFFFYDVKGPTDALENFYLTNVDMVDRFFWTGFSQMFGFTLQDFFKVFYVTGKTTWDTITTGRRMFPTSIALIKNIDGRSTIFAGIKEQLMIGHEVNRTLASKIAGNLYKDLTDIKWQQKESQHRQNRESIDTAKTLDDSNRVGSRKDGDYTIRKKDGHLEFEDSGSRNGKVGIKTEDSDSRLDLAKKNPKIFDEIVEKARAASDLPDNVWVPATNFHVLSDSLNIISNQLRLNQDVTTQVHTEYGEDPTEFGQNALKRFDAKVNAGLLPAYLKTELISDSSIADEAMAMKNTQSVLIESLERMYDGSIIVTGSPTMAPGDYAYISDKSRQMSGILKFREVQHVLTEEDGFITIITPGMFVEAGTHMYSSLYIKLGMFYGLFCQALDEYRVDMTRFTPSGLMYNQASLALTKVSVLDVIGTNALSIVSTGLSAAAIYGTGKWIARVAGPKVTNALNVGWRYASTIRGYLGTLSSFGKGMFSKVTSIAARSRAIMSSLRAAAFAGHLARTSLHFIMSIFASTAAIIISLILLVALWAYNFIEAQKARTEIRHRGVIKMPLTVYGSEYTAGLYGWNDEMSPLELQIENMKRSYTNMMQIWTAGTSNDITAGRQARLMWAVLSD